MRSNRPTGAQNSPLSSPGLRPRYTMHESHKSSLKNVSAKQLKDTSPNFGGVRFQRGYMGLNPDKSIDMADELNMESYNDKMIIHDQEQSRNRMQ